VKIALGPVQYYWSRTAMMQFYESVTDAPVDVVYLGEVVCSRRHELRFNDWLDIADMLANAGKEVVLSTQILLESGKDMTTLREIAHNGRYTVEANDMGAVHCVENTPFVAGPWLNVYNPPTLDLLAGLGARRWVMPLEMAKDGLARMQAERPPSMQTEVFAYGRMPLAFSARCFSARHRNFPKDNCQYVCMDHPDGLMMETQEGKPFLVLNGISTQSALVYNLIQKVDALRALHVDVLRLSPQSQHMVEIAGCFRDAIEGRRDKVDALANMLPLMAGQPCDGYWYGLPGLERKAV
jgi:collagenase-like PrtC family protease